MRGNIFDPLGIFEGIGRDLDRISDLVTSPNPCSCNPGNPYTCIPYSPALDIRNIESLPRGTGARYLVAVKGQGDELVAKRWARVLPKKTEPGEVVIEMQPTGGP